MIPLSFAVTAVAVLRLLEMRLAGRREKRARAAGAIEHGARHHPLFVILHAGWLLGWLVEGWVRGARVSSLWPLFATGFLIGLALRQTAIRTLGERWSTRVLVWPGRPPVRRGVYRVLRHPNYLGVAIEIACGPLIFGAWLTALAATALNAALLLGVRIPLEERALREGPG